MGNLPFGGCFAAPSIAPPEKQGALFYPEAVLFIDYNKRQFFESYSVFSRSFFGNKRMRADNYLNSAFFNFTLHRVFIRMRFEFARVIYFCPASRNESYPAVKIRKRFFKRFIMLTREYLGWSHKGRLETAVCRAYSRERGNYRFSRPHISLQKPVHRIRTAHIFRYFPQRFFLRHSEFEGEPRRQTFQ